MSFGDLAVTVGPVMRAADRLDRPTTAPPRHPSKVTEQLPPDALARHRGHQDGEGGGGGGYFDQIENARDEWTGWSTF